MKKIIGIATLAGLAMAGTAAAAVPIVINSGTARYDNGSNGYSTESSSTRQSSLWVDAPYTLSSVNQAIRKDTWVYKYTGPGQTTSGAPMQLQNIASPIQSASGSTATSSGSNGTGAGGLFDTLFTFNLSQPSGGQAILQVDCKVTSRSSSPLAMRVYNYLDETLTGTDANNVLTNSTLTYGSLVGIRTDIGGMYTIHYADNPDHYKAGLASTIVGDVYGGNVLNDTITGSAVDVASAFSWDINIAANGLSVTRTAYYLVNTDIPAPGSAALLGIGGLIAVRRRRA